VTDDSRHQVWTREGRVELKPAWEISSLGVGREQRTINMIAQYAGTRPPECQDATRDVYLRAYQRAGLLSGDPDAITTALPVEATEKPSATVGHPDTNPDPNAANGGDKGQDGTV
jgi:hypothetical protein